MWVKKKDPYHFGLDPSHGKIGKHCEMQHLGLVEAWAQQCHTFERPLDGSKVL